MKRTFLFLLLIFMILYGKIGYELVTAYVTQDHVTAGSLSDIAEEVTAIPLKTSGGITIERARNILQEGDNLFLISEDILYRFNTSGELISQITDPRQIIVAGYLIDPVKRCLVVMGNEDDVHFYSFSGKRIDTKKIGDGPGDSRIHTALLFNNRIWTAEECVRFDTDTQAYCVEKQVVEYDSSFQKIRTHVLATSPDLYNTKSFRSSCHLELGVSGSNGRLYAYSPVLDPANLLRDTLLIKHRQMLYADKRYSHDIPVYPLRFGKRYWISSCQDLNDPSGNYTFCFDQDTCKSWHIKGGFKDNFYHTGSVGQLKPLDIHGNSYYFCKTKGEMKNTTLEGNKTDNAVIFIVKLKA